MSDLIVQINGQEVLIETEQDYGSEYTGVGEVVGRAQDAFERATTTISNVSKSMVSTIRSLKGENRPNEFSLEFGIKFKIDGSVVLASSSGEATLTVKMLYKHPPSPEASSVSNPDPDQMPT
jgi:hypothetical protein